MCKILPRDSSKYINSFCLKYYLWVIFLSFDQKEIEIKIDLFKCLGNYFAQWKSIKYNVSMAKAGDLKTEIFLMLRHRSNYCWCWISYVVLIFSVLLLAVIVFSVSDVSVFLSRPGLYDSRKASMAASLGLYMLKPLSFCSQTTRVAVILLTFISDL